MAKKQLRKLIGLSIIIKCDFYDAIDRPIRYNLGIDDVYLYFSKEFLRFRKEDLINLNGLMRFLQVISLENQSVMSGEEVFLRGLFELITGQKYVNCEW